MAQPTYDELVRENQELRQRIASLENQVRQLEEQVKDLKRLLEQATRSGKRQAAPFSKGPPKDHPKPPGRKAGPDYGPKAHRPLPEQKPDEIIDVPLPEKCPDCGGTMIREEYTDHQYQVEIPRQPIVRRFDMHVGRCRCCGRTIRPRHDLQTSKAVGAASSQLGPDLQAMIALMKNKYGLSYGDIQGLLDDGFGISVSRGGAAHVVIRAGERSEPVYEDIRALVRQSDTVYPDETGWKVGGVLQWMWGFVTKLATLYVIRPCRGWDVPCEVLGADYDGRMIHDGWSPYDAFPNAIHQQCLAHLLRRADELLERVSRQARCFPHKVKQFLLAALALRDRRDAGMLSMTGLRMARHRLENRLDRLLAPNRSNEENRRFRAHLAKHRDEILTFLYHWDIEATNWPAEQAMRPAVVNRKVFGGNRTPAGAHAQEVLSSLFATCAQWEENLLDALSDILCTPPKVVRALPRPP